MKKGPKPLPHCKHEGCTLPRLLSPSGVLHSFCEQHQREDWTRRRRLYTRRKQDGEQAPPPGRPKASTALNEVSRAGSCKIEGCHEPRYEGTRLALCHEHFREYKRNVSNASYARRMGKPDAPPVTRAARPANEVTAGKARKSNDVRERKPETLRLLLVDKRTGEALRVTGTVTARVALEDLRGDGQVYERVAVALISGKG